jgi:hypothetical protein
MAAPDGLCGPGFSAWLEPRSGEQVIEIDPGTGCYALDGADWGVAGPAARPAHNEGLMVSRRSGTRLDCFVGLDRTAASRPEEPELR